MGETSNAVLDPAVPSQAQQPEFQPVFTDPGVSTQPLPPLPGTPRAREETMADDDLNEAVIQRHQNEAEQRFNRALRGLDEDPESVEPDPTLPLTPAQLTPVPPPPLDDERSILGRIGMDALQVLGGARDAFIETMQSIETVAAGLEGVTPVDMERLLPAVSKAGTVEGDIARSLSQFLTGFLPAMKGVRLLGVTGKILQPAVAGAVADFAVFDPTEPRMSNMLNELAPALQTPVSEYLASSSDDTAAEGRLKNAIEGVVLGGFSDTVFRVFKILKFGGITRTQAERELRRATGRAQQREARRLARQTATEESVDIPQVVADLSDEQIARAVEEEVAAAATRKQEQLTKTRALQARVAEGEEEAVQEALKGASITRSESGVLALRRGKRLIRFETEHEAATEILNVRLTRQLETPDPFDPQRALRSALGIAPDAPLPEGMTQAALDVVAQQRAQRPLVEVTTEGREQMQQFVSMEASGLGQQFAQEGERLRINFRMIGGGDDLKETIALVGDVVREQAEKQARGRQSIEELLARSKQSPFQKVANILGLDAGQALSPEDALAVREVWIASANRLKTLSNQVAAGDLDVTEDFLQQFILHANIHVAATGVRAEAGRTLRVFGIEMPSTDRNFLEELGRALEDSNGMTPQRLAQMVAAIPTQEQLAKFMLDSQKSTVGDAILEGWINSLLSGPQTQVANFLGNSMTTLWAIPERQLGAVLGNVASKEALYMVYGMKQGFLDGMSLFRQSFLSGEPIFDASSKLELAQSQRSIKGETFRATGTLGRAVDHLGTAITLPGRTLLAFDEFFKGLNYRMELNAQAIRQATEEGWKGKDAAERVASILDDPPETAIESARNFARYQTFTSALDTQGMAFERLGRAAEKLSEATRELPALKLVLPFIRTPLNIGRYAAERTPLGLFSRTVWRQLRSQGPEAGLARSKLAMGSMVLGVGALLSAEGRISGRGPNDPRLRKFKQQNDSWQPYSMRIGNTWVAYNRLEPLGSLFGLVADFREMAGEMPKVAADRVAGMILMSVWQNMSSKTFMRGLSEAMATLAPDNWADPKQSIRPGARFFEQLAGTAVPTFFAQLNRAHFDNTLRETHGVIDRMCSRIPGCSQTLKPRLNLWAEPIELHGGLGYDFISPLYLTMREPDDVDKEIIRLKLPLTMPGRSMSVQGGDDPIELEPDEYNDLVRLSAGIGIEGLPSLKEAMRTFIAQPNYQRADDFQKALFLRNILYNPTSGYRAFGRAAFLLKHPDILRKTIKGRLKGQNISEEAQQELQDRILEAVTGGTP